MANGLRRSFSSSLPLHKRCSPTSRRNGPNRRTSAARPRVGLGAVAGGDTTLGTPFLLSPWPRAPATSSAWPVSSRFIRR